MHGRRDGSADRPTGKTARHTAEFASHPRRTTHTEAPTTTPQGGRAALLPSSDRASRDRVRHRLLVLSEVLDKLGAERIQQPTRWLVVRLGVGDDDLDIGKAFEYPGKECADRLTRISVSPVLGQDPVGDLPMPGPPIQADTQQTDGLAGGAENHAVFTGLPHEVGVALADDFRRERTTHISTNLGISPESGKNRVVVGLNPTKNKPLRDNRDRQPQVRTCGVCHTSVFSPAHTDATRNDLSRSGGPVSC
jgi:hypothetical protein